MELKEQFKSGGTERTQNQTLRRRGRYAWRGDLSLTPAKATASSGVTHFLQTMLRTRGGGKRRLPRGLCPGCVRVLGGGRAVKIKRRRGWARESVCLRNKMPPNERKQTDAPVRGSPGSDAPTPRALCLREGRVCKKKSLP